MQDPIYLKWIAQCYEYEYALQNYTTTTKLFDFDAEPKRFQSAHAREERS